MKKLLLSFGLVASMLLSGQSRDLYSLAKGEYLGFNAVFDKDDNLYGYVAMYGYGKSGEKTKKFEYVFLDRNLNPVANKEFEGDITASNYYGKLDFNNNLLLIPYADQDIKWKNYFKPKRVMVDLKTNKVENKVYYDYQKGIFNEITEPKNNKEIKKEQKEERKKNGFVYYSYVYEIREGGFIVTENDDYETYYKNQALKRYDKNKKLMWEYRFNEDGTKKKREFLEIIDKDEKHLYAIMTKEEKHEKDFFLMVFDMKTGKILQNKQMEGLNDNTWYNILGVRDVWQNIDNDKSFDDDKIVVVGRLYDEKRTDRHYGFARWIIDKNTFESKVDVLNYTDFEGYLPKIYKEGYVEKGYRLAARDFFFLNDGSVGLLFEKFKIGDNNWANDKTTDIVYAFTDKDFKLKDVKVLEKQKTRITVNSDYLFSQYLNKGKDVVFFYRDYQKDKETKEKHWNLFINTLIGGKFNQEVIKISEKDKYFITPYVAKEGYILLREYNEKDKYNQIRLERLNY